MSMVRHIPSPPAPSHAPLEPCCLAITELAQRMAIGDNQLTGLDMEGEWIKRDHTTLIHQDSYF